MAKRRYKHSSLRWRKRCLVTTYGAVKRRNWTQAKIWAPGLLPLPRSWIHKLSRRWLRSPTRIKPY